MKHAPAVTVSPSDLTIISGALAALVAGATGSPHCALMCGPLACVVSLKRDARTRSRAARAWHVGRIASYMLVGALLGTFGSALFALPFAGALRRFLPWLMVAGLLSLAFDLGRHVPKVIPASLGLLRISRALLKFGERFSPVVRSVLRGAATPFLPCGLLYGAFIMAMGAGGPGGGALTMGAFSLGAIPALALVQAQGHRLANYPRARAIARHVVPLLAAGVVVWRTVGAASTGHSCH